MKDFDFSTLFPDDVVTLIFNASWRILLILIVAFVAYRFLKLLIKYAVSRVKALDDVDGSELDQRADTIGWVIGRTGMAAIIVTALLMALREVGIEVTPLLASVGVLGLALGLGAQTLVKDVIAGLFILSENQYTIGDVVNLNGKSGVVEKMTLRVTYVRGLDGTLHGMPNGDVRVVSNMTKMWSRAVMDIGITYDSDVDKALQVLANIGDELARDEVLGRLILEHPQVTGVEGLADWSVLIRLMVKTLPGKQWDVLRYVRKEALRQLPAAGVEIAFPRQDVKLVGGES